MSFGGGFVDGSDVAPVESTTPGWETTERLTPFQAVRLGFKESLQRGGFQDTPATPGESAS